MNDKEKMLNGILYDGSAKELVSERLENWKRLQKYNSWPISNLSELDLLVKQILGSSKGKIRIKPPFYCDYGYNIHVGENFFANYNLTILDTAPIYIGDNVKLGPNVSIFAAGHPIDPTIRNTGMEFGQGILIGNNVWIGGNTVINPGIKIGNNAVIGSGSVVTKDIPCNMVAVGNPCKVIRKISQHDKIYYFKNKQY